MSEFGCGSGVLIFLITLEYWLLFQDLFLVRAMCVCVCVFFVSSAQFSTRVIRLLKTSIRIDMPRSGGRSYGMLP